MSRTLIVFYSDTGATHQAALQLHDLTQWPIAEIRDLHPRKGLLGALHRLADSLLALPAHFVYDGPDLRNFDRVVMVSPIWLGLLASPMRGFLCEQFRETQRPTPQLSLVCVSANRSAVRAAAEMGTYTGHTPAPVVTLNRKDVMSGASIGALRVLAGSVQALDTWPAVRRPLWLSPRAA